MWRGILAFFLPKVSLAMVHQLTDETFKDFIAMNEQVFVKFYATWCGHCTALAPIWEELSSLVPEGVKIAKVNAVDEGKEMSTEYNVQGFPTLIFFHKGEAVPYNGNRKTDSFIAFIERFQTQLITTIDEHPSVIAETTVIFHFQELPKEALSFARDTSDVTFHHLKSDDRKVTVHIPGEAAVEIPVESMEKEELDLIAEKIVAAMRPRVAIISEDNVQKLITGNLGYFWFMYSAGEESSDEYNSFNIQQKFDEDSPIFVEAAKLLVDDHETIFLTADPKDFGKYVSPVIQVQTPCFVYMKSISDHRRYQYTGEAIPKDIATFVKNVHLDLIPEYVMSEDIPESNKGNVKKVVANNFEEIVIKSEQSVFVKFYSPTCPHCVSMASEWESLGFEVMNGELAASVIIAEINMASNRLPEEIPVSGFPTMILFHRRGGSDTKGHFVFKGDRTSEKMMEFMTDIINGQYPEDNEENENGEFDEDLMQGLDEDYSQDDYAYGEDMDGDSDQWDQEGEGEDFMGMFGEGDEDFMGHENQVDEEL